ncbi:hypothetical protein MMC13_006130 [Lambiella insularis]|nr:hypothetical protein [Lambiella insularis]
MTLQRFPSRGRTLTGARGVAAFPTQQLFILALCRICEPIAFMSIFPYIYHMISSFEITTDDNQIAIYAGLVTSAFAFAEFSTGVVWGRLSDKIGRKPVLIGGLAGTGLSVVIFGFAPNLPIALLGRALGGLLNGSILGPALGGTLAQPCLNYPTIFLRGTIFDRFPFLLPNLVCAIILACGVAIGVLFLQETHQEKKERRDIGLEAGEWILRHFRSDPECQPIADKAKSATLYDELRALVDDASPPGYRTTDGSPRMPSSRAQSPTKVESDARSKPRGVSKAFTKQVILNIAGYGLLA